MDAGGGWLIFRLPPADGALHPTVGERKHETLSLMCNDLDPTLAERAGRGVQVSSAVSNQGWGLLASIKLTSGADLRISEPRRLSRTTCRCQSA